MQFSHLVELNGHEPYAKGCHEAFDTHLRAPTTALDNPLSFWDPAL